MFRCCHFETGDFTKRRVFLEDREYGLALDCLVKACSDVMVTRAHPEQGFQILLGCRKVEPQPDWSLLMDWVRVE